MNTATHSISYRRAISCMLSSASAGAILLLIASLSTHARAAAPEDKTLPANTRFFIPEPADGSEQQAINLYEKGQVTNAVLIAAMELSPQAVWLAGGTPSQVSATTTKVLGEAKEEHAVPVFVLYNVPGRDCGSYSAGGAETTEDYETWIDAVAAAIGNQKVVIVLEPDAIADLPSDCGYDPNQVNVAQLTADRYTQLNYAVTTLEAGPQTIVYMDAGNSHWQAVGTIAQRMVTAGLMQAQGFFSNVSNFNLSNYESTFDTWVSDCIAFANDQEQGGWRVGHYDWCASQYYSPLGTVDPNNIATWIYTTEWYQQNMGTSVATLHFIIDTSRNGQGPFNAAPYSNAPYNQPAYAVQTLQNGSWCNPPDRGLGLRSTANTGIPLLDAYLWVKTPGQSDGTCDSAGGARAWDYSIYIRPGWPSAPAGQAIFDPLWGLDDPIAGAWFPHLALGLAQRAHPALLP
jgi:endoglucanase